MLALKREEEKLIREIKAAAKTNNQASLKILAKSLVRLRAQITKLHGSAANLKGVSTNLTVGGCCGHDSNITARQCSSMHAAHHQPVVSFLTKAAQLQLCCISVGSRRLPNMQVESQQPAQITATL